MPPRSCGKTLLELLTVLAVVIMLAAIALPAVVANGRGHPMMQSSSQLKGIHQSMFTYAQGNRSYFPGFNAQGELIDASPEYRFQVMLEGDYFQGRYMISPAETAATVWATGPVTYENYSYAMLRIGDANDDRFRRQEWRDTANSLAVVMSDRNTGFSGQYQSVWTNEPGVWRGSVAWNDNHVTQETSPVMENTQYGESSGVTDDNLFETGDGVYEGGGVAVVGDGAMMTFSQSEFVLPSRGVDDSARRAFMQTIQFFFVFVVGGAFAGVLILILSRKGRRRTAAS